MHRLLCMDAPKNANRFLTKTEATRAQIAIDETQKYGFIDFLVFAYFVQIARGILYKAVSVALKMLG